LVTKEWEQKYPKVKVSSLIRVGLDHNPILVDDGTNSSQLKRGFKFEIAWLTKMEFKKKLIEKWSKRGVEGIQDFWKRMKKELRQLSKRIGASLDEAMKRRKTNLLLEIERLDKKAEWK
jgi:hypothetical protein